VHSFASFSFAKEKEAKEAKAKAQVYYYSNKLYEYLFWYYRIPF
jgi:hypothetical protein